MCDLCLLSGLVAETLEPLAAQRVSRRGRRAEPDKSTHPQALSAPTRHASMDLADLEPSLVELELRDLPALEIDLPSLELRDLKGVNNASNT